MSNRKRTPAERLDRKTRSEMKKAQRTNRIDDMLDTMNDLNRIEDQLNTEEKNKETKNA